jgi:hypothetical protein
MRGYSNELAKICLNQSLNVTTKRGESRDGIKDNTLEHLCQKAF